MVACALPVMPRALPLAPAPRAMPPHGLCALPCPCPGTWTFLAPMLFLVGFSRTQNANGALLSHTHFELSVRSSISLYTKAL